MCMRMCVCARACVWSVSTRARVLRAGAACVRRACASVSLRASAVADAPRARAGARQAAEPQVREAALAVAAALVPAVAAAAKAGMGSASGAAVGHEPASPGPAPRLFNWSPAADPRPPFAPVRPRLGEAW